MIELTWPIAEDFITGYRATTRYRYRVELRRFIRWATARELTPATIRECRRALRRCGDALAF